MAISHVAGALTGTSNPTTSWTVALSSSIKDGDHLLLWVVSRDHTSGDAYPTVVDDDTTGELWERIGGSNNRKFTVWRKVATPGTASKTVTVSGAIGSSTGGYSAFNGILGRGNPVLDFSVEENTFPNVTHAAFTLTVRDCMVLGAVASVANSTQETGYGIGNAPAIMTQSFGGSSTGGSDCAINVAYQIHDSGWLNNSYQNKQLGTIDTFDNLTGDSVSIFFALAPVAPKPGDGAYGDSLSPWSDVAWGDAPADSNDATGALQANTGNVTSDLDGTVQNPVSGALAATTAGVTCDIDAIEEMQGALQPTTAAVTANLDGIVANPVTGSLQATTAPSTADFDAVEAMQGALQAQTAGVQANLDGQVIDTIAGAIAATTEAAQANLDGTVANPVTGALQATTDPAIANLDGIAGEETQPPRGALVPDWRERLEKALKPKEKPAKKVRKVRVLHLAGEVLIWELEGVSEATVTHVKRAAGEASLNPSSAGASARRLACARAEAVIYEHLMADAHARRFVDEERAAADAQLMALAGIGDEDLF